MEVEDGHYAVIFSSRRRSADAGYAEMAARMESLAAEQPGYLGHESFRDEAVCGITVSYWRSEADIRRWKAVAAHREAQQEGRAQWYASYRLRVCKVIRDYAFEHEED